MSPVQLSCEGFALGAFWVPPFQLNTGVVVCLHLPFSPDSTEAARLIQILTGARSEPGVHAFGHLVYAQPAQGKRAHWASLFREETVREWLHRSAQDPLSSEEDFFSRFGIQASWKVSQLGYNQRLLLSLEAAFQNRADAIIFSTVGGDPTGYSLAVEWFSWRRERAVSGIYLSFPFVQNGRPRRFCFPGGTCVDVSIQPVTPLPLNSSIH